jgi:5'-nucleotidase
MRILLSNDDGIFAPGLAALYRAVAEMGEVTVVAPASAQSAAGQAISVRSPLVVGEVEIPGTDGFRGLGVEGRPADCVRLAIRELMGEPPDLVLSGINAGANVGIHVFYSGTVGAAAEGAICGAAAVAFSAEIAGFEPDYPRVAEICRGVLDRLRQAGLRGGDLINVNVPALKARQTPRGLRLVSQSAADVQEEYRRVTDPGGRQAYALHDFQFQADTADSDVNYLARRYVTVTPLSIDRTDAPRLAALRDSGTALED